MVAVKGKGWVIAPSALRAVHEADLLAPNRSRKSDGSVGDAAHASRSSFHNPWDGYVDAVDITHDPAGGFDAHAHARRLAERKPSWLDHIISNREIASSAKGWVWRAYTGTNPHDKHIHVANKRTTAGRNYAGPIFGTAPQEEDMQFTPEQQDAWDQNFKRLVSLEAFAAWASGVLAQLAERDPNVTIDAKALADAIPDTLAQDVADELAKRLAD